MTSTDWKSVLAALGGTEAAETNEQVMPDDETTDVMTLPKKQQKLRVSMERSGRGGKTVTLVRGFVGTSEELAALGKHLKQCCGVGGSEKDGEIIIQGDHRTRLVELLRSEGYTQTK